MTKARTHNIYQPQPATLQEMVVENAQIKTLILRFNDRKLNDSFSYQPGQFMMVSVMHCGEAPISIASTPTRPGVLHLSVRKAGKLTAALHELAIGDQIGLRGPFGRPFPMTRLEGRDLLFVAGGIGLAPLRAVIDYALDHGDAYGRKVILYGSRLPSDIAFQADIDTWRQRPDTECHLTVDRTEPGWDGPVGVVTTLLDRVALAPATTTALLCGPPIMIDTLRAELAARGFAAGDIITTMERHMKCGVGICGHCHMENKLVCTDGPVFTAAEL